MGEVSHLLLTFSLEGLEVWELVWEWRPECSLRQSLRYPVTALELVCRRLCLVASAH